MFVISFGNPFDGMSLRGPFASLEAATSYADDCSEPYNVLELEPPVGAEYDSAKAALVIAMEGGLVSSVSTDTESLKDFLEIIIIDYDTEGSDDDELTDIYTKDTAEVIPAHFRTEQLGTTVIDTDRLLGFGVGGTAGGGSQS